MKKTFLVCVLFALQFCRVASVWAVDDPGDKFLEAYFLIQEGDTAERQADAIKAVAKYNAALEILSEIKAQSPDWNPHIIEFRTKYINEHLAALKPTPAPAAPAEPQPTPPAPEKPSPQVEAPLTPATPVPPPAQATPATPETPPSPATSVTPAAPAAPAAPEALPAPATPAVPTTVEAPPAPVVPATPEAPATTAPPVTSAVPAMVETPPAPTTPPTPAAPVPTVENDTVKQLTAELQRAREQVHQLEEARNELNAKLQEQLGKVAPTQTNPQIEELLKMNQDLAAKLATVQTQIAEARERVAAAAVPAPVAPAPVAPAQPSEVEQLRTELAQTRGELQHAKEELQDTRVQLDTTKQALEKAQADNAEMRHSYEQVIAQLTDANKKLSSAKAASDKDDEIIRQLRKENALLRIIAERKASASIAPTEAEESAGGGPSIPELRGWRPHARPQTVAKQQPKTEESKPQPQPPPSAMEESGRGKLVATLTSPKKTEPPPTPEKIVVTPAKTQTNAPAKPAATEKKSTPPAPSPAPIKETVKAPAPAPKPKASGTPTVAPAPPPPAADVRQLLNQGRAALALKALDTASAKYLAVLEMEPTNVVALPASVRSATSRTG